MSETMTEIIAPEAITSILIPISQVRPSPANPRNFKGRDQEIEELSRNIQEVGLMSPVLLRPVESENGGPKFELVAGERRFRACKKIWNEIPAFIRELSDNEAHELTVVENLQREDLSPIEEANGVKTLLDSGRDQSEIADHLGKPLSWVIKRAKLRDLTAKWKTGIADPECALSRWPVTHLEMIARFVKSVQNELFDHLNYPHMVAMTKRSLQKFLDKYQLRLKSALWKLSDATLHKKAGACTKCQKRSSIQPLLFDQDTIPAKDDSCLDRSCWSVKERRTLLTREKELRKEHKNLKLLHRECNNYNLADDNPFKDKVIESYDYNQSKKGAINAVPVLIIGGTGVGKLEWWARPQNSSNQDVSTLDENGDKLPAPLKERRKKLTGKRSKEFITLIYDILEAEMETPNLILNLPEAKIITAAVVFGTNKLHALVGEIRESQPQSWTRYHELAPHYEKKKAEYLVELMQDVFPSWRDRLSYSRSQVLERVDPSKAREIAGFLCVDYKAMEKEIEAQIKEPKTWANLNEDGSQKKAKQA